MAQTACAKSNIWTMPLMLHSQQLERLSTITNTTVQIHHQPTGTRYHKIRVTGTSQISKKEKKYLSKFGANVLTVVFFYVSRARNDRRYGNSACGDSRAVLPPLLRTPLLNLSKGFPSRWESFKILSRNCRRLIEYCIKPARIFSFACWIIL